MADHCVRAWISGKVQGVGFRWATQRAAVAAGADGLIVEVHGDPPRALSDGAQSLYPDQFASLMVEIKVIAKAIARDVTAPLS